VIAFFNKVNSFVSLQFSVLVILAASLFAAASDEPYAQKGHCAPSDEFACVFAGGALKVAV
jgi:hypothetical protein